MLIDVADIGGTTLVRMVELAGSCGYSTVPPESAAMTVVPLLLPRHFNRHRRSPSPTIATTPPRAPPTTAAMGTDPEVVCNIFVGPGGIDVDVGSTLFEPADVEPANVINAEPAEPADIGSAELADVESAELADVEAAEVVDAEPADVENDRRGEAEGCDSLVM